MTCGSIELPHHNKTWYVYVVYTPSQFIDKPRQPHLEVAHKVLKYIIQSLGQEIFLPSIGLLKLQVFYDTD